MRCGDLDAGVDGDIVLIACECGASMARRVDEADDARRPCPPILETDPRLDHEALARPLLDGLRQIE
jgi:hypothetical protein